MSQIGRELIEIDSKENQNKNTDFKNSQKKQKLHISHNLLKLAFCLFLGLLLIITVLFVKNVHEKSSVIYADKGLKNDIIVSDKQKEMLEQILLQRDNGKNKDKKIKYELILRVTKDLKNFPKIYEMGEKLDGTLLIAKTPLGFIFGGFCEYRYQTYPDYEEMKDYWFDMQNVELYNFQKNKICIGNFNENEFYFYKIIDLHEPFEIIGKDTSLTTKDKAINFEETFDEQGPNIPFDELEIYKITYY